MLWLLFIAGDCEYIDDPLTIPRTLLRNALNRDVDCVAGVASKSWFWSGRGDQAKSGDRNMAIRI